MSDLLDPDLFGQASIAFDLDGTLVDTAPDLVRALNATIQPDGLTPVPVDDLRALVGRGAQALLERAYAQQGRVLSPDATPDLVARFIDIYQADIAAHSRVFPQVETTLARLQRAGATLSVCTNKPSVLSDLLIAEFKLTGYFARIIGPDRTTAKKPAADHVHTALGTGHRRAAMVGDSAPDVDAARAARVPSIVLSYGYSEAPAGSLGADRLLHDFGDIPGALADIWRA
ncbi:HAD hydrolase-like protein [Maricaulis salignorans]|uniref:phosphoglycolate phosphatase n=1 Tax=Maricaulis salignorans TaxID=144026 RepID=A0A1G9PZ32_9PROT|nr:HAD hydrolase-like protein [Maricaulis salignorans]SDM04046.1 phosphoglycolate phosphatase [Maricaulis salignorans]